MDFMTASPGDQARYHRLRRMKLLAHGLLILAGVVYCSTLAFRDIGWVGFVNAGAEAAMVGALADWFAVVAIFDHPLGLKIKHTALVKTHKDRVGRSLETFFTNNFLTEEIIRDKVASADIPLRVAEWLAAPQHRRLAIAQLAKGGRAILARISDDDVAGMLEDSLTPKLESERFAPMVGSFMEGIVADDAHRGLVDLLATQMHEWLRSHPDQFRDIVATKLPSWIPVFAKPKFHDFAYSTALSWASDVRYQPQHQIRLALDSMLAKLARDLQHNPTTQAHADHLKASVLANPQLGHTSIELWHALRSSLENALAHEDSALWRRCDQWLLDVAHSITSDTAIRTTWEAKIEDAAAWFMRVYGPEVITIISSTIESWDPDQASERIELFVGPDLQFIRMNGTIVGCLAGLVIHAATVLLT